MSSSTGIRWQYGGDGRDRRRKPGELLGTTVTINPRAISRQARITIDGRSNAIQDLAGNAYAGIRRARHSTSPRSRGSGRKPSSISTATENRTCCSRAMQVRMRLADERRVGRWQRQCRLGHGKLHAKAAGDFNGDGKADILW